MPLYRLSFLLALLVLVAACDSGGNQPDPTLGGQYAFETPPDDSTTGTISIAETDEGSLVGSGSLRIRDAAGNVVASLLIDDIEGTHDHPDVSMQWTIEGQGIYVDIGPWEVEGTVSNGGNRITGTLTRDEDTAQIVLTAQ